MKEFNQHFSSKPAFTSAESRHFVVSRGASKGYYKLMLHNLVESGRIRRITKGAYTFYDEVQYVGFAYRPFYYGLEDALSLRGIWNQQTNPVVVTPRVVRTGVRDFEGRNYIIRRLDRSMFFGYSLIRYGDFYIPVSDNEKTLIDLVYFKLRIPDSVYRDLIGIYEPEILEKYLSKVPAGIRKRVCSVVGKHKV